MSELKPCPWCGGSAELHVQDGIEEIWLWFKCVGTDEVEGCGASSEGWDTLEGAVKRWNSRPEEDRLNTEIDRLKAENEELKACPFCGGEKLKDGYNSKYDIFCSRCGNFDNMKSLWNTRPIEDKLKAEIVRLKAEISKHAVFLAIHGVEGYEFVPNPTCDDCDLNPPLCDSCIGA